MATVQLTPTTVTVRFTRTEKILGLLRDVTVSRGAVRGAEVVPDPLPAARGLRAPGLALPGRRVGTWWRPGERTLVCVRRGELALRLRLAGAGYDALLVGTADAAALADALAPAR